MFWMDHAWSMRPCVSIRTVQMHVPDQHCTSSGSRWTNAQVSDRETDSDWTIRTEIEFDCDALVGAWVTAQIEPWCVSKNDDRKNLQALCNACHKKKTSFERKMLKLY